MELKNKLDDFLQDYDDIEYYSKHYKNLLEQAGGIPGKDGEMWERLCPPEPPELEDLKGHIDNIGRMLIFVG